MSFKTSINIKFDVGNEEFLKRYIPSPSHSDALRSILDGFIRDSRKSHIIVGPYGTGKSLLATLISSIVSGDTSTEVTVQLVSKFLHFDDYIANQIEQSNNLNKRYIPVMITGNEGRFRETILSNIVKKLNKEDIDVILPGVSEEIIKSINYWKAEFPKTYQQFLEKLKEDGKNLNTLIYKIKIQDAREINYFTDLYPSLTSGASFNTNYSDDFLTKLEYLSQKLVERNLGVFIVYDEFARFLQDLNPRNINEAMQDIQDLAEIVERQNAVHLLFITHKSFHQYFKGSNEEIKDEFGKIEKRFSQYHITSDQATFLKIAEVIISENLDDKPTLTSEQFKQTAEQMKEFTLFPSLNPRDRDDKIINRMYPLHPVTLYLLPDLSNIFGQNERTLFTFLESEELGGLKYHMNKSEDYYKPYQLFDYFFPDLNNVHANSDVREQIINYKKAKARIPETISDTDFAINILKTITLWSLAELQSRQKLYINLLSFALNKNENEVSKLLSTLVENRVLRYNKQNQYWEVHTGSAINIQEKIESKKLNYKVKENDIPKILEQNLKVKYFFPDEYNDEKEMTRFAKVELLVSSEMPNINLDAIRKSDVTILYIIPKNDDEIIEIPKTLTSMDLPENVLFAIHNDPLSTIKSEIIEYTIIIDLLADKKLLSEDKGIKEELSFLLEESKYAIYMYLKEIILFNHKINWKNQNEIVSLKSSIDLSNYLSNICNTLYRDTPVILNDSINRIHVTANQRNAAIKVVNSILTSYREDNFGIEGNGPDYAIYAAIFRRNRNFQDNVSSLNYDNIAYQPYRLLRERLIEVLDNSNRGIFSDIIGVFEGMPFGIRRPIIPILLVALLRDRWDEIMLYRNDMYVNNLNGDTLFDILYEEGPENYEYAYDKISEGNIKLLVSVEKHFPSYFDEQLVGQSRLIRACGALLKWLRSLPKITQLSQSVTDDFIWLRECIRKMEVKPQESVSELYSKYREEERFLYLKEYAENYLTDFNEKLLHEIYEVFQMNNLPELKNWSLSQPEELKKNNKIITIMVGLEVNDEWLSNFVEAYIGVQVNDWSDNTHNFFLEQLQSDYEEINSYGENNYVNNLNEDYVILDIAGNQKVISKVDLSVKSQNIYKNIDRIIKNAGRNIPKEEMKYVIFKLLAENVN